MKTSAVGTARGTRAPHPVAPSPDPAATAQQQALAAQHQAFDLETAESAELEREREALEELMLAQLKDEDEVVKKMIAMI